MKIVRFEMHGDVDAQWNHDSEVEQTWGLTSFRYELSGDRDPVEGVVVEVEEIEDGYHLTVLMSDDHAARWAVAPESGPTEWNP